MNSDTVWGNQPAFTSSLDGNRQTSRDEATTHPILKEFHPNSPSLTWDVWFRCFVLVVWQVLFLSPPNLSQGQEGLQIWSASSPPPHPPHPPGFLHTRLQVCCALDFRLRQGENPSPNAGIYARMTLFSKNDQHIPCICPRNMSEHMPEYVWEKRSYRNMWQKQLSGYMS